MKQEIINRMESITREVDIAAKCISTMIEDSPFKSASMMALDAGLQILIEALNAVIAAEEATKSPVE